VALVTFYVIFFKLRISRKVRDLLIDEMLDNTLHLGLGTPQQSVRHPKKVLHRRRQSTVHGEKNSCDRQNTIIVRQLFFIRLEDRLQPNIGNTLGRVLTVFTVQA